MAISPQRLTIYLYSAHRAVIFAIAQLSCLHGDLICIGLYTLCKYISDIYVDGLCIISVKTLYVNNS